MGLLLRFRNEGSVISMENKNFPSAKKNTSIEVKCQDNADCFFFIYIIILKVLFIMNLYPMDKQPIRYSTKTSSGCRRNKSEYGSKPQGLNFGTVQRTFEK